MHRPSAVRGMNGHFQPQISRAHARSQLQMMLVNTTDERLAAFTAEGLAAMYRLEASEIAGMLADERERRAEYERCHAATS